MKIAKNVKRDVKVLKLLEESGWKVLTVWECELRKNKKLMFDKIEKFLNN